MKRYGCSKPLSANSTDHTSPMEQSTPIAITLYRADNDDVTDISMTTSWTPLLNRVHWYTTTRLHRRRGQHLYRTTITVDPEKLLDLRTDPALAFNRIGLDLEDYDGESLNDLLRALLSVVQAHDFHWVAFRELRAGEAEEWLYVGTDPLPVERV
jgi:hypothetical protein